MSETKREIEESQETNFILNLSSILKNVTYKLFFQKHTYNIYK